MTTPEISVVVPSHGRRLRVWWLLNALEEQTLDADRYEVVLVHDYADPAFLALLEEHPLALAGTLRSVRIEPGTGSPSRQRNIGWREARAGLIAFTDDDCRADRGWLAALLETAAGAPGAIVQGATRPDPLETALFAAPHHRSLRVDPPNLFAQTCNIAYPRDLLERLGGFDEAMPAPAGEDTDLALRARAAGAEVTGAADALIFHSVEAYTLAEAVRLNSKWQHLVYVFRKHPQLRDELVAGVFWRRSHAELVLALAGLALAGRRPLALALTAPYLKRALNRRGPRRRARVASALELPGQAVVDLAEVLTMARGSVRYRLPVL
jgi:glycosyltransferase involved in cell wall biosynthesis